MSNTPVKPLSHYPQAEAGQMPVPPPAGSEGETVAVKRSAAKVAVLEFLDPDKLRATVILNHPFRYEGVEYHSLELRALSVMEVGEVSLEVKASGTIDLYPYFAAMCVLPPEVLRALPADDGGELIEKAGPFLPRFVTD